MRTKAVIVLGVSLIIALGVVLYVLGSKDDVELPTATSPSSPAHHAATPTVITAPKPVISDANPSNAAPAPTNDMTQRVAALEAKVQALERALSGVSLEKAAAERNSLFAAEEGYLKVDEYAAAGQHAIAGEGYLTFLQSHPQHPDARDIMKKARDAFLKAGYNDKAFWVHEEMMKAHPQNPFDDVWEQAQLEKDAGLFARAAEHAAQAAELAPNVEDRLWKRVFWAYYLQLGSGNQAGIDAMRQVQQEIARAGITHPKLAETAQQRLTEWGSQLARTGR